jgi:septum formation inhibitor-activating ATPase MinD
LLYQLQTLPLWLLLAGSAHARPGQILESPQFAKVFAQFTRQFDWIIVDSSQSLEVGAWSKFIDGTLLVIRAGLTPMKALRNVLGSIDRAKLIGMLCNDVSEAEFAEGGER